MSAALLANSDRQGWPSEPAACFWASLKSLCDPGFAVWRRFVALTMWRNSAVRSLMAIAILAGYVRSARMAPEWADDGCRNVEKAVSPMEDYVRMNAYMCSNSGSGGVVRFLFLVEWVELRRNRMWKSRWAYRNATESQSRRGQY